MGSGKSSSRESSSKSSSRSSSSGRSSSRSSSESRTSSPSRSSSSRGGYDGGETRSRSTDSSSSPSRSSSKSSSKSSNDLDGFGGFMDTSDGGKGIGGGIGRGLGDHFSSRSRDSGGGRARLNLSEDLSPASPNYNPAKRDAYNATQTAYAGGLFSDGKVTPEYFRDQYGVAVRRGYENLYNKSGANMIGSAVLGAVPSTGNQIVDGAIGLAGSNLGGILGAIGSGEMSEQDKIIQDYVNKQMQDEYDKAALDSPWDYVRAVLRGAFGAATLGASEAGAGLINGAIDREQGLDRLAEKYGHIGGIKEFHDQQKNARAQSLKEDADRRAREGDNGSFNKLNKPSGILPTMQAQTGKQQSGNTMTKNPFSYDFSSLSGLWDNLKVT